MSRRGFLKFSAACFAALIPVQASALEVLANSRMTSAGGAILLDGSGISNVQELAAAIRLAAGAAWSDEVPDQVIYQTLIDTFGRYARYAAEVRLPVAVQPDVPIPVAVRPVYVGGQSQPTLVFFRIMGLGFAMPASRFFSIIIASVWFLSLYLDSLARP